MPALRLKYPAGDCRRPLCFPGRTTGKRVVCEFVACLLLALPFSWVSGEDTEPSAAKPGSRLSELSTPGRNTAGGQQQRESVLGFLKNSGNSESVGSLPADASVYVVRASEAEFYPYGSNASTPVRLTAGTVVKVTKPGEEWSGAEVAQSGKGIIRTAQIRRARESDLAGPSKPVSSSAAVSTPASKPAPVATPAVKSAPGMALAGNPEAVRVAPVRKSWPANRAASDDSSEAVGSLSADASLYVVRGSEAEFHPYGSNASTPVRLAAGTVVKVTKPGDEWSGAEVAQSGKGIIRTAQIRRARESDLAIPAVKRAPGMAQAGNPESGRAAPVRKFWPAHRPADEVANPVRVIAQAPQPDVVRTQARTAASAVPSPEITIDSGSAEELSSWNNSFFPTLQDTLFFGNVNGGDYPRRYTGGPQGPDLPGQNHTGLYPYDSDSPSYGLRRPGTFARPIDRMLGIFVPNDAWVDEGNAYRDGSLGEGLTGVVDADFPFFTQSMIPERAHLKAGPFYLDLLSLGAGVLYSDFESDTIHFPEGEEDGWLEFIELQFRAAAQLTDTIFLSTAWSLYYLPGENELGIRFPYGEQFRPYVHLDYISQWGDWDVRFYDEFWVNSGIDLFWEADENAYERAGRYQFGFYDSHYPNGEFFDSDRAYVYNTLGALGSAPIDEWRLWLGAEHTDYWKGFAFDDHANREHVSAALRYEGLTLPFAPYAIYDFYTFNNLDSFWNRFAVGGHGRITENISAWGQVGYAVGEAPSWNYDDLTWELGLTHHLSEATWHRITVGEDFHTVDYAADSAMATRFGYELYHHMNSRLRSRFFAQLADEDYIGRTFGGRRNLFGLDLDYRPFDYTHLTVGAFYEKQAASSTPDGDLDRWLYYAGLTQRIASRMTAWLRYQMEDDDYFDERMVSFGMNRYF